MQCYPSAQHGTKEWGNEAARVPLPGIRRDLFGGALVLKDAGLLGLLRLMPCRLKRFTTVPRSKASSVLDVSYLLSDLVRLDRGRPAVLV